jgi:hypothetical protein
LHLRQALAKPFLEVSEVSVMVPIKLHGADRVVSQLCQSNVTVVSQWCYSGVTVVLQWCYSGVTVVLQWCDSGVTVVLQWCYSGVTVVLPGRPRPQPAGAN